jgi:hypothetical protein
MPQFKKFTAETVEVSEMNDFIASQVVGTFDSDQGQGQRILLVVERSPLLRAWSRI